MARDDQFRSKKFVVALLIYAATTLGLAFGRLDGEQAYGLYLFVGGFYASSNVLDKMVEAYKGRGNG